MRSREFINNTYVINYKNLEALFVCVKSNLKNVRNV